MQKITLSDGTTVYRECNRHSLGARDPVAASAPPRETDAYKALLAAQMAGRVLVLWHDGRPAMWDSAQGAWVPMGVTPQELETLIGGE